MRPTYTHTVARARQVIAALCISLSLSAQSDRDLFDAYLREDMTIWKEYIDTLSSAQRSPVTLLYEYGYCGYIVAEAKKEGKEALLPEAKKYVQHFKSQVSDLKYQMPLGYYEMFLSAVYVYELRLHESIHPVKSMNLAKEATKLAPEDPIVLSYYGTCLFYAPKPFGSKQEALKYFKRAEANFHASEWDYCWIREATLMYIRQCQEKLNL